MELHQLRYFTAVAELENFTRAAERCFVSQPSLSQQIIKLEQELGHPLLERLGRKARLTDAGRAFYERAVRILAAVDEARTCAKAESDWEGGQLTIGAIVTVAPYLIPPVVRRFLKQYPEAAVSIRENLTQEVLRDCLSGDLDAAIVALPIEDRRFEVTPLFTEELQLALPAKHVLLRKRVIATDDLGDLPFVLLNEIHCLGEQIVSFCRQLECQPVISCQTAQLMTVQEMVGLGLGVSLVPAMAATVDRSKQRVYRSLGEDAPRRTLALVRHRDRHKSRLLSAFIEVLRETCPPPRG